jgi:hypothetical protein
MFSKTCVANHLADDPYGYAVGTQICLLVACYLGHCARLIATSPLDLTVQAFQRIGGVEPFLSLGISRPLESRSRRSLWLAFLIVALPHDDS